jgi:hypothetical protein
MRHLSILFSSALLVLVGCTQGDGVVTDDSSEVNEGRSALERPLDPPVTVPSSPFIGASVEAIFADAKGSATVLAPEQLVDGCSRTKVEDATTQTILVERIECQGSDLVRFLEDNGTIKAEHADLNKDGKVDRYSSETDDVAQYTDTNFDGEIDVVVERVERLKDFSMTGYGETFPQSKFLYRIREDRDRDKKLDLEKLIARGTLPKAG